MATNALKISSAIELKLFFVSEMAGRYRKTQRKGCCTRRAFKAWKTLMS